MYFVYMKISKYNILQYILLFSINYDIDVYKNILILYYIYILLIIKIYI